MGQINERNFIASKSGFLSHVGKADWLAFVPGTDVPNATKAMALTESLRKMKQPRCPATSPMMAVQTPIMAIERTKQGYPLPRPVIWMDKKKWGIDSNGNTFWGRGSDSAMFMYYSTLVN